VLKAPAAAVVPAPETALKLAEKAAIVQSADKPAQETETAAEPVDAVASDAVAADAARQAVGRGTIVDANRDFLVRLGNNDPPSGKRLAGEIADWGRLFHDAGFDVLGPRERRNGNTMAVAGRRATGAADRVVAALGAGATANDVAAFLEFLARPEQRKDARTPESLRELVGSWRRSLDG
jgi:hypothetical protein